MFDQIKTKSGIGIGLNKYTNSLVKNNISHGYMAGEKIPMNFVDDTQINPLKMQTLPLREKTMLLRKTHQQYHQNVVGLNGQPLPHGQLPPVERMPLYSAGRNNEGQMNGLVNFLGGMQPTSLYSREDARDVARAMIGSVGLMPSKKIDERFEGIDQRFDGLSGEMGKLADYNKLSFGLLRKIVPNKYYELKREFNLGDIEDIDNLKKDDDDDEL